jgi:hypothetical protein
MVRTFVNATMYPQHNSKKEKNPFKEKYTSRVFFLEALRQCLSHASLFSFW